MRKQFGAEFRAKVAIEALRGEKTITQISSEYGVHPNRIGRWRKELQERCPELFKGKRGIGDNGQKELIEQLYRNIGELKVENDWLKKKLGF